MVNPNQLADDMKRNNGFIPGIKPGRSTSEFIDDVISRITLPGSIFLAIIAILPTFALREEGDSETRASSPLSLSVSEVRAVWKRLYPSGVIQK